MRVSADANDVGIDSVTARVRELESMVQSVRLGVPPGGAQIAATGSAFASTLQSQLAAGGSPLSAGAAAAGTLDPDAAAQLTASTQGLGIEAMLAGATPAVVAAPRAAPRNVTGDLKGLDPELLAGLEQVAAKLGKPVEVISGHRTHAEQEELYRRYQNGTGNLAAVPGTSRHETGNAADVYVGGVALADVSGARDAAAAAGLGFPVPGEAWHVERVAA